MSDASPVWEASAADARRQCRELLAEGWRLLRVEGLEIRSLEVALDALGAESVGLIGAGSWDALDDTLPYIIGADTNPWDRIVLVWENAERLREGSLSAYAEVCQILTRLWQVLGLDSSAELARQPWAAATDGERPVWFLTVMVEGRTGLEVADGPPWYKHLAADLGDILNE